MRTLFDQTLKGEKVITQIQQDIENQLYEILKKGQVGKEIIEGYRNQSIEELAEVMTLCFKMSRIAGGTIKKLNDLGWVENFEQMCYGAFKSAMLRLLKEAKANEVKNGAKTTKNLRWP